MQKYAEIYYKEYSDILTKNFRTYLEQELYIDVIFLCKHNKKVPAHQIVLGSFSSFLYQLFSDHQQDFKGHVAYICIPDIKANNLRNILKFIYYGKVALRNKRDLSHLYEHLALLDLPSNVIRSENEPFCEYISGIKNANEENQPLKEIGEIKNESFFIAENDCGPTNSTITMTTNADGVSSSSSLPIISDVITLVADSKSNLAHADRPQNVEEYTYSTLQDKQDLNPEQQITSTEPEESSQKNFSTHKSDVSESDGINSTLHDSPLSKEELSNKKKNHLLAVLKEVAVACQNLESVGVNDDERTRVNLQSRLRIVKQCIVDINDLLSTEVTISSHGNQKFIDVEKDWELKIMLDNCLETLPRLEKAIENSNNRSKRHRRRERRDSIEKLDY